MDTQAVPGELVFFCGKMGAGKSTLASRVADERGAVLLSEDTWLAALYPGQIDSVQDYKRCSDLLKAPLRGMVCDMLRAGVSVVMDFPGNTVGQRRWLRAISDEVHAAHCMYWLDVADEVCLRRVLARAKTQPQCHQTDTEAMFHRMATFFTPPSETEGLVVERWDSSSMGN